MENENAFLCDILVKPEDATLRLRYANWLEERGDPRARLLRIDPCLDRVSYVAWLETRGTLDYYVSRFPEVNREADERQATEPLRKQRHALSAHLDPGWVAFLSTLGCPFEPFYFFNNTGHGPQPDEMPFAERIGTRGAVVTFESDFRQRASWDPGLLRDLHAIGQLELDECFYGSTSCPIHPFLCELKTQRRPLTGADVLVSLRPRDFRSRYIETVDVTNIPFPGYNPGDGDGTHNDEIHTDFAEQYIFQTADEDTKEKIDASVGTHGALKQLVVEGHLWYVVLHTTPQPLGEYLFSKWVVLFAVGQSSNGDRLLGVVTHQDCHNLCD